MLPKKENTTTKTTSITISTIKTTTKRTTSTTTALFHHNMKWKQNGTTVAGGNENGNQLNQLVRPHDIHVDDDENQTLYIVDYFNSRIMKWKMGAENGEVIAGGNVFGGNIDQLAMPVAMIVDKKTDSLIICDMGNRRVVRWSLQDPTDQRAIILKIGCCGLAIDSNGDYYAANSLESEVRRWKRNDREGEIVAGGNEFGTKLNQFSFPTYIFVDKDHSVYVSDQENHRVMKWLKGAKEGRIVAGGHGVGDNLTQLNNPQGVIVDHSGNVIVVDSYNHRIMRWLVGATEGSVVVGGNGWGNQSNQLTSPKGLSFDLKGNLYVADNGNNRIQKFDIGIN